jgi:hypothetical protein
LTGSGNTQNITYASGVAWPNTITVTAQEIRFDGVVDAQNAYGKAILEYVNQSLTKNDTLQSFTPGPSTPYNYTIVTYPTSNAPDDYLVVGQKQDMVFYFVLKGGTVNEALNFMSALVSAT